MITRSGIKYASKVPLVPMKAPRGKKEKKVIPFVAHSISCKCCKRDADFYNDSNGAICLACSPEEGDPTCAGSYCLAKNSPSWPLAQPHKDWQQTIRMQFITVHTQLHVLMFFYFYFQWLFGVSDPHWPTVSSLGLEARIEKLQIDFGSGTFAIRMKYDKEYDFHPIGSLFALQDLWIKMGKKTSCRMPFYANYMLMGNFRDTFSFVHSLGVPRLTNEEEYRNWCPKRVVLLPIGM